MRNRMPAAALLLLPCAAFAHVTLAPNSAAPGTTYVAHFRVGHGCSGSPTIELRIAIPADVSAVQPEAMPGWTLETTPHTITWKGGTLPAATPGTFTMAMTLPAQPDVLAFAATQTCVVGVENWSDLPGTGQKPVHPAPLLYVGTDAPAANAPKPDTMAPGMVMPDGSHM